MMQVLRVLACALLIGLGPEGVRLPASVVSATAPAVSTTAAKSSAAAAATVSAAGQGRTRDGPAVSTTAAKSSAAAATASAAGQGRTRGRPASSARVTVANSAPAPVTYSAPLSPLRVVRSFDPPTTRFGPGHLGVDLAATTGTPVRAAADGVVQFAGPVAGRGLVVVLHADGVSTEYEPIRPVVSAGVVVRRGEVLGVIHGTHGSCAAGRCLHWGARRGSDYLDPLLLLQPIGPVRLLPWPR